MYSAYYLRYCTVYLIQSLLRYPLRDDHDVIRQLGLQASFFNVNANLSQRRRSFPWTGKIWSNPCCILLISISILISIHSWEVWLAGPGISERGLSERLPSIRLERTGQVGKYSMRKVRYGIWGRQVLSVNHTGNPPLVKLPAP